MFTKGYTEKEHKNIQIQQDKEKKAGWRGGDNENRLLVPWAIWTVSSLEMWDISGLVRLMLLPEIAAEASNFHVSNMANSIEMFENLLVNMVARDSTPMLTKPCR